MFQSYAIALSDRNRHHFSNHVAQNRSTALNLTAKEPIWCPERAATLCSLARFLLDQPDIDPNEPDKNGYVISTCSWFSVRVLRLQFHATTSLRLRRRYTPLMNAAFQARAELSALLAAHPRTDAWRRCKVVAPLPQRHQSRVCHTERVDGA